MRAQRASLSRHAELAKAMDHIPKRWPASTRFLGDRKDLPQYASGKRDEATACHDPCGT